MTDWNVDPLPAEAWPVDLGFLNESPAGGHGFVRAEGEGLVFEDGTEARFWGVNLQANAIFQTSDAELARHARRIAALGFNLVRLHHHDSMGFVRPSVIDHRYAHSQGLNPKALSRLDAWIAALRRQGVYVWLDLHTGRVFKEGDEVPGFEELLRSDPPGEAKGFVYVNPRLQELQRSFNAAFLSHQNPRTGLAYKDDPAIAGVLLTNENDLTQHFGRRLMDPANPVHRGLLAENLRPIAERLGTTAEALLADSSRPELALALNQIEHDYNQAMRAHLSEIGFRGVVTTTNLWGGGSLSSLPSIGAGDLVDVHSYAQALALRTDPGRRAPFTARIALGALLGRPVSISEWNHNQPLAAARHAAPLYLASLARLQGWDAMMLFGYSNRPLQRPGRAIAWSSFKDPAVMGLMPAAALVFRQGHVEPARRLFVLEPGRDAVLRERMGAGRLPALRTLVEQSRVAIRLPDLPELPWAKAPAVPETATRVTDLQHDFLVGDAAEDQGARAPQVVSDTGELRRDWRRPLFSVDTPHTQVASGRVGTAPVVLSRARFEITTDEATVAVTSLDGQPLERSTRILVSAVGRTCPEPGAPARYRTEPIRGTVHLRRRSGASLTLRALDLRRPAAGGARERLQALDEVAIPLTGAAHWWLLDGPPGGSRKPPSRGGKFTQ